MSSVSTRTLVLRALGELLSHKAIPPTSLELSLALGCTSEELNNVFIETFALPTDQTLHYLSSEYLAKTISPLTGRQDVTLIHSRRQQAREYAFRYDFYETYDACIHGARLVCFALYLHESVWGSGAYRAGIPS
mgnify:CR=1 FL=1